MCRSVSAGVLLAAADHNVFAFVLPKHYSPTCTLAKHIVYTHLKLAHKATGIFIRDTQHWLLDMDCVCDGEIMLNPYGYQVPCSPPLRKGRGFQVVSSHKVGFTTCPSCCLTWVVRVKVKQCQYFCVHSTTTTTGEGRDSSDF